MPADVTSALVELSRVFVSLNVRWYVFGAQAVIAAGVPRLTADVDVTAEVATKAVPSLIDALERHGFAMRDVGDVTQFIAETRVVPAVHVASTVPVDVILAGPGLEEEMLGRVRMRNVRGVSIPFIATPDLIALKMLAGREKDLEDIRAVIRAAPADLSIDEARARVVQLGELLDDPALVSSFDQIATRARAAKKSSKKRGR